MVVGGTALLLGVGSAGTSLALETRAQKAIANFCSTAAMTAGMQLACEAAKKKYPQAIHRPTQPSDRYNCHGLTFGARRTGIIDPTEVERILVEDNYVPVALNDIIPGDIAVYRSEVEITHSGIVVSMKEGTPWILSKWGKLHEVIHRIHDCDYKNNVSYYRIVQ